MIDLEAFNHRFQLCCAATFRDPLIVTQALTHDSYGPEGKAFERLEFLGDGCLEMVIAETLYLETDLAEGQMSPFRSSLTRTESLASILREWEMEAFFRLGPGMNVEALPDSVYADFFESLLGAYHLDRGFEALRELVRGIFLKEIQRRKGQSSFANPKTQLQEWTMAKGLDLPKYKVVSQKGPDHQPVFTVEVIVGEERYDCKGSSVKGAEMAAAQAALDAIAP